MYNGSMYGKGINNFAVWGYVIANMTPDKVTGAQVELNPKKISDTFGCEELLVSDAITFLCSPDAKTTTPDSDGRRLEKIGTFAYRVVNGSKYMKIRNEEERREQNRLAQAKFRETHPKHPKRRRATATYDVDAPINNSEPSSTHPPIPLRDIPEAKQFERPRDQDSPPAPVAPWLQQPKRTTPNQ